MSPESEKKRIADFFSGEYAVMVAFGFAVMYLWNWLMPALFGFREITFLQAFAMVLLAKILFGGFHGHHGRDREHSFFPRRSRDDGKLPDDVRGKRKEFALFWREEGREAFERYCERTENKTGSSHE